MQIDPDGTVYRNHIMLLGNSQNAVRKIARTALYGTVVVEPVVSIFIVGQKYGSDGKVNVGIFIGNNLFFNEFLHRIGKKFRVNANVFYTFVNYASVTASGTFPIPYVMLNRRKCTIR
jgi:hypothetical protein